MRLKIQSRTSFIDTLNVGFTLMLAAFVTRKTFGLSGDQCNLKNKKCFIFQIASVDKAGRTEAELDLLMVRKWTKLVPQLHKYRPAVLLLLPLTLKPFPTLFLLQT